MPRYPGEPEDSCPHIDEAISCLEKTRSINDELRTSAREFHEEAEKAKNRVEDLEAEVSELKRDIETLEKRVQELEEELANAQNP